VRSQTGAAGRYRISVIGWIGIVAIVLGLAYFVLLPDGAGNASDGKSSAPGARAK
jgi:hypothetical protein